MPSTPSIEKIAAPYAGPKGNLQNAAKTRQRKQRG